MGYVQPYSEIDLLFSRLKAEFVKKMVKAFFSGFALMIKYDCADSKMLHPGLDDATYCVDQSRLLVFLTVHVSHVWRRQKFHIFYWILKRCSAIKINNKIETNRMSYSLHLVPHYKFACLFHATFGVLFTFGLICIFYFRPILSHFSINMKTEIGWGRVTRSLFLYFKIYQ